MRLMEVFCCRGEGYDLSDIEVFQTVDARLFEEL